MPGPAPAGRVTTIRGCAVLNQMVQYRAGIDIDIDTVLDAMQGEDGALGAERGEGAVSLQMSTLGETGTERCLEVARSEGIELVDAPVLGT